MAYRLIAVTGPLKGDSIAIGDQLLIGRTTHGLNLPDQLVSMSHARMEVHGDALSISDLGSKHGTLVNGEPLTHNTPRGLVIGDTITIGESTLRVDTSANRALRAALWMMMPAWVLVAMALLGLLYVSGEAPLVLTFRQPVRTPAPKTSLVVPPSFARSYGLSLDALTLLDVRDDDNDGVDEIWLGLEERELIVSFGKGGGWIARGSLPKGCTARTGTDAELSCHGTIYQLHDNHYVPVLQEGVVVWMGGRTNAVAPVVEGEEPVPLSAAAKAARRLNRESARAPYQVRLDQRDALAGFLASRGIHQPVHWLLCEGQGQGLPAQARLADGSVRQLEQGCGDALHLGGTDAEAFAGSRVMAVALTATAWNLLPKDLSLTLSGAVDDRLADPEQRAALTMWGRSPVTLPILDLRVDAPAGGSRPDAGEDNTLQPTQMVAPTAVNPGTGGRVLNHGTAMLSAGGCKYRVRTARYRCALVRGCLPGRTFMDVTEQGCGDDQVLLSVGYGGGVSRAESERAVVQLDIDAVSGGPLVTQITRAQVGIRPK